LFFLGTEGVVGPELWKSDGTAAGAVLVKDISATIGPKNGQYYFTGVGGTLFFTAFTANGRELWKSDGTANGTVLVKDINPVGNSRPNSLTNVNGTLFFRAVDGVTGYELWKSDGTLDGTVLVKNISEGAGNSSSSSPHYLTNVDGTLF